MLAWGVFFDLLPIILLIIAGYFVVSSLGMGNYSEDVGNLANADQAIEAGGFWNTFAGYAIKGTAYTRIGGRATKDVVKIVFFGGASAFLFGPFIYMIGSLVASTLAYFVFIIWFYIKGVNILTFSSAQRVLVNIGSIIVEHIPGLDLLPGITFMVWRHVVISRAEDALKDSELLNKTTQQLNILNKMRV